MGAHLSTLLIPPVSFLGAYCGWQHIKMQRKVTLEQYTHQIEHMLQNPPWPPPALPAQIVHSMVQYSLQHAQIEDGATHSKAGQGTSSSSAATPQKKMSHSRNSSDTGRERLPRVDEVAED